MRIRLPFLADAGQVVRPVFVCVVGISVAAIAMALKGWQAPTICLGALAGVMGVVLLYQVHRAVESLRDVSAAQHRAALDAERHYADVLTRMVRFAESRDRYIQGHSERIGQLCERLGRKLGLPEERCGLLNLAGQLHDVGLLAVPAGVLNQNTRLSVENFRCMRQHARIGYEVLKPLRSLEAVHAAILHHHERMNGTGYPFGLAGESIPLEARIVAVADAYDAMTHDRPHRAAIGSAEAVRELRRCAPAGYDPLCVEALAEILLLPDFAQTVTPATAVGASGALADMPLAPVAAAS